MYDQVLRNSIEKVVYVVADGAHAAGTCLSIVADGIYGLERKLAYGVKPGRAHIH